MRRRRANWSSVAIILLSFVVIALVVCFAATSLRGCNSKLLEETETSATTTVTPTPTSVPDKPSITEEEVGSYTDSELLAMFGGPREFKRTSTKIDIGPRVEKTGFIDGVTYDLPEYDTTEEMSESDKLKYRLCEELLSNPIYATGVDEFLREAEIIGHSTWAEEFNKAYNPTTTEWWETLIEKDSTTGKWYNKMDHHLRMCRYACFIQGLTYVGEVDSTKVICHFPLDPEMEVCFKSENDEKYAFWVYKYVYKDGTEIYIGINKFDYRWALIPKPPTPTPTNSPTPTPSTSTPTPTPTTTTSTPTPTPTGSQKRPQDDPINRNTDDNAAADIGSPSNPANHDNDMRETPEPTSPGSYDNVVTPTPTTAPTGPTSTPTTTPSPTPTGSPSNRGSGQTTPRPTPSVEPGVADDGINTGTAPNSDPG